jgi:taurine dioxygenase
MGPININRFFKSIPDYPQIAEVRKEPAQTTNIGGGWHTDHSYDQIPALGSVLLAREVPSRGGDTMFACLAQAYDSLSDGLKRTLKGLRPSIRADTSSGSRPTRPTRRKKIAMSTQRRQLRMLSIPS